MKLKNCARCKNEYDTTHYVVVNKKTGLVDIYCPGCRKLIRHEWYLKHKQKHIAATRLNSERYIAEYYDWRNTLTCILCEEDDACCVELHHVDPTKKEYGISNLRKSGMTSIMKEADKCIPVCSNCHKKIHNHGLEKIAKKFNKWRQIKQLPPVKELISSSLNGDGPVS